MKRLCDFVKLLLCFTAVYFILINSALILYFVCIDVTSTMQTTSRWFCPPMV